MASNPNHLATKDRKRGIVLYIEAKSPFTNPQSLVDPNKDLGPRLITLGNTPPLTRSSKWVPEKLSNQANAASITNAPGMRYWRQSTDAMAYHSGIPATDPYDRSTEIYVTILVADKEPIARLPPLKHFGERRLPFWREAHADGDNKNRPHDRRIALVFASGDVWHNHYIPDAVGEPGH